MYSEEDINSAVTAGALSAESAAAFRAHMTQLRELPRGSEENFRLINSFNDIFVAIGVIIMLVAAGAIGQALGTAIYPPPDWNTMYAQAIAPTEAQMKAASGAREVSENLGILFGALFVAATAWPLAEFFTRKRRMALPSIILLLAYVGGVFAAVLSAAIAAIDTDGANALPAILFSVSALVAAGAAYLHWRRFMVPITVAAGSAAIAATVVGLLLAGLTELAPEHDETIALSLVFLTGLAVFAFAMWWDIGDRERITRRSDVAFWLHLLAAPMIAHPVFALIGVIDGDDIGTGAVFAVLGVYIVFGLVALAIDRRALLVSALAYVLIALTILFDRFGAVELSFALTALVIGSALLSLSAFWAPIRRAVVSKLPTQWQARLPDTTGVPASATAPA